MIHLTVGPNQEDNEKFGGLLHHFRDAVGYSRAEAAQRLGLSSEYVRMLERGERTAPIGRVRDILNHYEVDFVMDVRKMVINDEVEVEFTSRILEARNREHPRQLRNRAETLGEILALLIEADDELLDTVRMFLLVKERISITEGSS